MLFSCAFSFLATLLLISKSEAFSRLIHNRKHSPVGEGLQPPRKLLNDNFLPKLTELRCSQRENRNDNLNRSLLSSNNLFEEDSTFESGPLSQVMPYLFTAGLSVLLFGGMITFFRPLVINAADSVVTFSQPIFDPSAFQPVCPASDSFYQLMKSFIATIIGQENIAEYGPLVASGDRNEYFFSTEILGR